MRGRRVICLAGALALVAGCSASSHVAVAPPRDAAAPGSGDGAAGGGDSAPGSTAAPLPSSDAPAAPAPVTPVTWQPCSKAPQHDVDGWECGTVEVPLDYERPDGQKISIALVRFPATDPATRIGSLFVNPGGPGGSGIDTVHLLRPELPADVTARFDIVGFDPRGVGASTHVDCLGDKEKDLEADQDQTPDTPAEVDAVIRQRQAASAACAAAQGDLLPYLGTMNAARDLDRLRAAVGDEQLSYLGYSYGGALGATYADLFPDRVRALVLDGPVDPAVGVGGEEAARTYGRQDFAQAFDRFADACSAVTTCSANPDPAELLGKVRAAAEKAPVPAPTVESEDGRKLTPGLVETGVKAALFDTATWPFLAVGLRDAAGGDGSTLVRLADTLNGRATGGQWTNRPDAFRAIQCADFPMRPDTAAVRAAYTAAKGKPLVDPDAPRVGCLGWPATAEPLRAITSADTPPVLVIGTKGDPAAVYENAAAMARALGHGVVLTWEGDGHTAFPKTTCVSDAVTRYLVDVEPPAKGTTCPADDGGNPDSTKGSTYALNRDMLRTQIEAGFERNGTDPKLASCILDPLARDLSDDELVHFFLGIHDDALAKKQSTAAARCGAVFQS
jgi:pimeloyl-ACP methyl ester carboxylesterase